MCVTAAGTTPRASTAIASGPFSTGIPSRPSRIRTRAFVSLQPLTHPLPSSEQGWCPWGRQPTLGSAASPNCPLGGGNCKIASALRAFLSLNKLSQVIQVRPGSLVAGADTDDSGNCSEFNQDGVMVSEEAACTCSVSSRK